jgi:DNA-binding Xre family transcriptional regulator
MIDYIGLEVLLREKGKNLKWLHETTGVSWDVIRKFKKGESVSLSTIERICIALDCNIENIVQIKKEPAD